MIGVVQSEASAPDKASSIALLERMVAAASQAGVSLLCFPELFLTGYHVDHRLYEQAEALDGPSVSQVLEIAKRYGVGVIFGMPERDGTRLYNTAVAVTPTGRVAGSYRKIHLFGPHEAEVFERGTEHRVIDMCGLRVGLAICYDIEFPEMARALCRAGAQIICVPTANMQPFVSVATTLVRARALENGLPVLYSNFCGNTETLVFTGGSGIVAYDGTDRARAGTVGMGLVTCARDSLFPIGPEDALLSTQLRDLRLGDGG